MKKGAKKTKSVRPAGPGRPIIRVCVDWEERLSMFLQDAIAQPHREPEICEELIEYVQFLVRADRNVYRQKCFNIVFRATGLDKRKAFRRRRITNARSFE